MLASDRLPLVCRAAVAALALLVYAGTLGHGFVYDDEIAVEHQEVVRGHRFAEAFTTPYHAGTGGAAGTGLYRPLTVLTFALQHAAHGPRPGLFHAANVALHAVVSVLVFDLALALALPLGAAAAAAALFAVHPVHVEAVAGIAGRPELLAALFFVLAFVIFARARGEDGAPTTAGLAGTAGAFFLALLSKENAIVLPVVAIAWEILTRRRPRRIVGSLAAFGAPVAVYLAARAAVLGGLLVPSASVTFIENPMVGLAFPARVVTALAVVARYAILLVFPRRLSPDWGHAEVVPVTSPLEILFLAGSAIAAGAIVLAVLWWRKRPSAVLALVLGAATWFVVSNVPIVIGVGMAERLLYLPSAAFCLLAGLAGAAFHRRAGTPLVAIVAGILLVAACARTVTAAAAWRDDFTLFSAAEPNAPRSVKVLGNLGVELASRGRTAEARALLERSSALAPRHVATAINFSGVLLQAGDLAGAKRVIGVALEVEPDNAVAHAQMGTILRKEGSLVEAEASFRRAVAADPSFTRARLDLAGVLHARGSSELREGRVEEAIAHLTEAARLAPGAAAIGEDLRRAREGASAPRP